ncbi:Folylpolyglutamate synthase/Dihydropteroate synthase [Proteiniphilum saccharofermentans]|uniref:Dihydrofolate synthase/folylpolyglutamate synthase n=1 Tax=Proteiniphilum saccharofermentans TaxID=1642647 RepID=A0A1R3SZ87_9BACT|nr:folylpolyglutamate synthase/dihydrofolate synthase family protein [Proteiniphilum saccharofermentans]SCD20811.1 Folylpolyglutamate synthase/Dihydropteroate synthase [Proteiniphilum saccharofermentans]
MTYDETIDYLYRQMPEYQRIGDKAYKPGLDNSLALDEIFDHPHQRYKTIHVGGTNGKGSVSHLLAAILQESGYKVGLYTSPHLIDFRERIRVNGEMISREFVMDFVEHYREQFEPVMPSFFELTMEMAFLYFAQREVDVAVIEVGLGGRLDSTNIISPDLSIITNIGFDHMKQLGNTLPKIAAEKAGIIKAYTPVVIGEAGNTEVTQVFIDKAQSVNAPIVFAELYMNNFKAEKCESGWLLFHADGYPDVKSELRGLAQDKNARTVLTAVEVLLETGYVIPKVAVYKGFANVTSITGLMGRWQQLQTSPKIICDIAHNAHGIRYVAEQLQSENFNRLHMVFGMANDKDIDPVLSLLPRDAVYYFTKASVERALDEKTLAQQAETYGLKGNNFGTVTKAIEAAKENADKNDLIFIGGSSFIVADALPLFI